jgi:hypothetical protein
MMGVDVIELQSGCLERGKLRIDLGGKLATHRRSQEDFDSRLREVAAQPPLAVDEPGNAFRRQRRCSIDENEVQADAEPRQPLCALDGVGSGCAAHHETRSRKNAFGVSALDTFVDFRREAEIVGRDDERLQCAASCRSGGKWKNSTLWG